MYEVTTETVRGSETTEYSVKRQRSMPTFSERGRYGVKTDDNGADGRRERRRVIYYQDAAGGGIATWITVADMDWWGPGERD